MSDSYATPRRYRRIQTTLQARISTIEPERDPWTGRPFFRASHETCANVSRGGAFFETTEPLRPGRRLLIELQLPGGEPVEAIGRVAWAKKKLLPSGRHVEAGIGVEFLGSSREHVSALATFIERAETEPTAERSESQAEAHRRKVSRGWEARPPDRPAET